MTRIVVDTNVVISAFISEHGSPAKVIDSITDNKNIQICYNDKILKEYIAVFTRDKFKKYNFDFDVFVSLISFIKTEGFLVNPATSNIHMPDEKDRIFYDTAKEANAIIVTGNIKHFPKESFIVSPSEYIETIAN